MAEIGKDLDRAKHLLQQGKLVAIPTETVYGLAANALDANAVLEIFKAKNRPHFDPLIVHVAGIQQAETLVESFPEKARLLTQKFWPGPLTLLLNKKNVVPDLVTSGLNTVGLRCPDHDLTRTLLQGLSFPLAAPSANPFGYVSPTTPQHVNEQLGDSVAYILDGGECRVGIESTIIGFEPVPTLFRLGGLEPEKIEPITGPLQIQLHSSSNPHAPGQLLSHYAPHKKIVSGTRTYLQGLTPSGNTGAIVFQHLLEALPASNQIILSPTGHVEEAAQHLFAALRTMDKSAVTEILAELAPETGLGLAINDRLRRASVQ